MVVHSPGDADALSLEARPLPAIRPGWVRIRICAIGLSRTELYARRGDYPEVSFPRVLGTECVGVVDEADAGAHVHEGQAITALMGGMGRLFDGCYAEYVLAPLTHVMPITSELPWHVLAALPKSYLAAQGALETLDLRAGQTLLIRGGSSSVGLAALTLARDLGATVIATTRATAKVDALRAAGADYVIVDSGEIAQVVQHRIPGGAHGCLELVGAATLRDSLLAMAPKGVLCTMGVLGDHASIEQFQPLADIPSSVRLTTYASRAMLNAERSTTPLRRMIEQVGTGRYPSHVDKVFSFVQLPAAHRYMEENRAVGKVVATLETVE
jgi:NADPH:quinone reductase-like Zn-dependent oxidoreductase